MGDPGGGVRRVTGCAVDRQCLTCVAWACAHETPRRAGQEATGALSGRRKVAGGGAHLGIEVGHNSHHKLEAYCGEIA